MNQFCIKIGTNRPCGKGIDDQLGGQEVKGEKASRIIKNKFNN